MQASIIQFGYKPGVCRRGGCSGSPVTDMGFCPSCQASQDALRATVIPPARRNSARCGTTGGYQAHIRRKEDACPACRMAHSDYVQGNRAQRNVTIIDKTVSPGGH